jgi:hypothetical protein
LTGVKRRPGLGNRSPIFSTVSMEDKTMAKVAREVVQRAGIDVDKLLEMLVRNAAAELTTYYYYTIMRVTTESP